MIQMCHFYCKYTFFYSGTDCTAPESDDERWTLRHVLIIHFSLNLKCLGLDYIFSFAFSLSQPNRLCKSS